MTIMRVAGVEYDLGVAMEEISNGTIKAMAKQSALVGEPVTMDYLERTRVRIEELKKDPDVSELAVATDVGSLDMLTAYIFIAKRHAGEQVTWSQAESFPTSAVDILDDDDEADEPDPKASTSEADLEPEPSTVA